MLVALILVVPRFNPWNQHLFNKLIDNGDRFNSDQILLRNMLGIWSELVFLIRICSENLALSLPFGVKKILSGSDQFRSDSAQNTCLTAKTSVII